MTKYHDCIRYCILAAARIKKQLTIVKETFSKVQNTYSVNTEQTVTVCLCHRCF